jgi:MFS family permease
LTADAPPTGAAAGAGAGARAGTEIGDEVGDRVRARGASARTSRWALLDSLTVRNYRLFAGGQVVSLVGTWMQLTALDWLVVDLGGGGDALGVAVGLQFLPTPVFGLYAGLLADRTDKRRLLLATQSTAGLLAAGLCALVASGHVTLAVLFVFAALLGTVNAFDTPTRQAFVSELVGVERVPNAIAINSITFNSARVVGPAVGGLLLAAVGSRSGAATVFGANAASYLAVLAGLARMRVRELYPARRLARAKGQLRAGVRYAAGSPVIAGAMALVAVVGTLGMNFPVTLTLMARRTFHGGAATYGTLTALVAVGGIVGAVFTARRRSAPRPRTLIASAAVFGLGETVGAAMPNVWAFGAVLIPTGAALLVFTTSANATVQLATDAGMRGRVMAVYILVLLGTTPLGAPTVGAVADWLGPRAGLALGGLGSLAAAAAGVTLSTVLGWFRARSESVAGAGPAGRADT